MTQTPSCARCKRTPEVIPVYQALAVVEKLTPEQYVLEQEGTLDPITGKFLCDECYVAVGGPSRRYHRWTATPENLKELAL